jgi:hypothetical protein
MWGEADAMEQERSHAASSLGEAGFGRDDFPRTGFARAAFGPAWLALTVAFALHVLDEATTGFLNIYNPTVLAMRERWGWFPMPTFEFREWLFGLIAAVAFCFVLTPVAARNARWLRPLAWFYALIMFLNSIGHTAVTILGHTVANVSVARPAPGFYSSPFLFIGSIWLMVSLVRTAPGAKLSSRA